MAAMKPACLIFVVLAISGLLQDARVSSEDNEYNFDGRSNSLENSVEAGDVNYGRYQDVPVNDEYNDYNFKQDDVLLEESNNEGDYYHNMREENMQEEFHRNNDDRRNEEKEVEMDGDQFNYNDHEPTKPTKQSGYPKLKMIMTNRKSGDEPKINASPSLTNAQSHDQVPTNSERDESSRYSEDKAEGRSTLEEQFSKMNNEEVNDFHPTDNEDKNLKPRSVMDEKDKNREEEELVKINEESDDRHDKKGFHDGSQHRDEKLLAERKIDELDNSLREGANDMNRNRDDRSSTDEGVNDMNRNRDDRSSTDEGVNYMNQNRDDRSSTDEKQYNEVESIKINDIKSGDTKEVNEERNPSMDRGSDSYDNENKDAEKPTKRNDVESDDNRKKVDDNIEIWNNRNMDNWSVSNGNENKSDSVDEINKDVKKDDGRYPNIDEEKNNDIDEEQRIKRNNEDSDENLKKDDSDNENVDGGSVSINYNNRNDEEQLARDNNEGIYNDGKIDEGKIVNRDDNVVSNKNDSKDYKERVRTNDNEDSYDNLGNVEERINRNRDSNSASDENNNKSDEELAKNNEIDNMKIVDEERNRNRDSNSASDENDKKIDEELAKNNESDGNLKIVDEGGNQNRNDNSLSDKSNSNTEEGEHSIRKNEDGVKKVAGDSNEDIDERSGENKNRNLKEEATGRTVEESDLLAKDKDGGKQDKDDSSVVDERKRESNGEVSHEMSEKDKIVASEEFKERKRLYISNYIDNHYKGQEVPTATLSVINTMLAEDLLKQMMDERKKASEEASTKEEMEKEESRVTEHSTNSARESEMNRGSRSILSTLIQSSQSPADSSSQLSSIISQLTSSISDQHIFNNSDHVRSSSKIRVDTESSTATHDQHVSQALTTSNLQSLSSTSVQPSAVEKTSDEMSLSDEIITENRVQEKSHHGETLPSSEIGSTVNISSEGVSLRTSPSSSAAQDYEKISDNPTQTISSSIAEKSSNVEDSRNDGINETGNNSESIEINTDETNVLKLPALSDPNPRINKLMQLEVFQNLRRKQVEDYIAVQYPDNKMSDEQLLEVDGLIIGSMKKDLKMDESGLLELMKERAGNEVIDEIIKETSIVDSKERQVNSPQPDDNTETRENEALVPKAKKKNLKDFLKGSQPSHSHLEMTGNDDNREDSGKESGKNSLENGSEDKEKVISAEDGEGKMEEAGGFFDGLYNFFSNTLSGDSESSGENEERNDLSETNDKENEIKSNEVDKDLPQSNNPNNSDEKPFSQVLKSNSLDVQDVMKSVLNEQDDALVGEEKIEEAVKDNSKLRDAVNPTKGDYTEDVDISSTSVKNNIESKNEVAASTESSDKSPGTTTNVETEVNLPDHSVGEKTVDDETIPPESVDISHEKSKYTQTLSMETKENLPDSSAAEKTADDKMVPTESVDIQHEKSKYTQTLDYEKTDNEYSARNLTVKTATTPGGKEDSSDPLKKLCQKYPSLQACQVPEEKKIVSEEEINSETKDLSIAGYIKAFTLWFNSIVYTLFSYVVNCVKSLLKILSCYTVGIFLNVMGKQEVLQLFMLSIDAVSTEKFAVIFVLIINHLAFYFYFKRSTTQPVVCISDGSTVDHGKIEGLEKELSKMTTKLQSERKEKENLKKKVDKEVEKNKRISNENENLKKIVNDNKGDKDEMKALRKTVKEHEKKCKAKETEVELLQSNIQASKDDLKMSKDDFKNLELKYNYVVKELDIKDKILSKMENSKTILEEELSEKDKAVSERDESISDLNKKFSVLEAKLSEMEQTLEEHKEASQNIEAEKKELQETLLNIDKITAHRKREDGESDDEEDANDDEKVNAERLASIIESTKIKAAQVEALSELNGCKEELSVFKKKANELEDNHSDLTVKFEFLCEESSELKKNIEKKDIELSTISKFFGEREAELQRLSITQKEEIQKLRNQMYSMGDDKKQRGDLMKKIEDLQEEIMSSEKQFKEKLADVEEQSHSNYLKMRTAIRECDEHKREKEVYRKRLLDIDMTPKSKSVTASSGGPVNRSESPGSTKSADSYNDPSAGRQPSHGPIPYAAPMFRVPPPFRPNPMINPMYRVPPPMGPYNGPPRPPFMRQPLPPNATMNPQYASNVRPEVGVQYTTSGQGAPLYSAQNPVASSQPPNQSVANPGPGGIPSQGAPLKNA